MIDSKDLNTASMLPMKIREDIQKHFDHAVENIPP